MRRAAKVDENQAEIVRNLRKLGASVEPALARCGSGCPDLLVGYRKRWLLLEVKAPKGKLEPAQVLFHGAAQALQLPCHVVYTVEDCRKALTS